MESHFFLNHKIQAVNLWQLVSKQADMEAHLWALSYRLTWVLALPGDGVLAAFWALLHPGEQCRRCSLQGCPEVFILFSSYYMRSPWAEAPPQEVESTNYGGKFYWADIQDQVGLSFSLFSYWKRNSLS